MKPPKVCNPPHSCGTCHQGDFCPRRGEIEGSILTSRQFWSLGVLLLALYVLLGWVVIH